MTDSAAAARLILGGIRCCRQRSPPLLVGTWKLSEMHRTVEKQKPAWECRIGRHRRRLAAVPGVTSVIVAVFTNGSNAVSLVAGVRSVCARDSPGPAPAAVSC